jgi:hypothetical protein
MDPKTVRMVAVLCVVLLLAFGTWQLILAVTD